MKSSLVQYKAENNKKTKGASIVEVMVKEKEVEDYLMIKNFKKDGKQMMENHEFHMLKGEAVFEDHMEKEG